MTLHSRHVWLAVQATTTVVLLAVLFRKVQWRELLDALTGMPPGVYLLSLLVVVTGQLLYTLKWRLLLSAVGVETRFGQLLEQYLIGLFFNNFLPSTVGGDWAKIHYLGRQKGYADIGMSVIMDRLLGMFYVSSLAAILIGLLRPSALELTLAGAVLASVAALLGAAFSSAALVPFERVLARFPGISARSSPMGATIQRSLGQARVVVRAPLALVAVAIIVIAYFVLLAYMYRTCILAASGRDVSFWPVMMVVTTITALSNVPISLNGMGLREQLHFTLLASLGVAREVAVAISVLLFGHLLLLSLIGCGLWLRLRSAGRKLPVPEGLA